ncbi:SDR family NAD(P)-dependent oxidoreductase [Kineococcus rhizosphaerae]|uniref:NAD(P)-dependent dehydrogenase (Short-subunit alcohol dehydrogenase family) n=1 Tax=Kineococcus rhizosphaerae TaxID=559628 RepID=A0A2T0QUU3_9ACTN|nr:SDR family oxidoreductase [Kineococcus rhizosphaerae]PRY08831.1 NAD(P)-dependent dehydrogenase (short-subunit alcohol dehydrogenase family) [Kineococcus rhizosphaerae]
MSQDNSPPTALVTGGSQGIGLAVASVLLARGWNVTLAGRGRDRLDSAITTLRDQSGPGRGTVEAVTADVAAEGDIDRLVATTVARWGHIDGLVNNAGIFDDASFLTLSAKEWNDVLAVNLTGPFLLTQRVASHMKDRGGGSIVNIASIDGHRIDGTYPAYNVSKAGLLHLTRQAAVELGPHGIRCNSVSPGWTKTPMVEAALTSPQLEAMTTNWPRAPLGRMVSTEEVARTVAFLLGEDASGITAADVVVDAGTLANLWLLETLPS